MTYILVPGYSPGEPAYSPSIQGQEVTGNTTPHPGFSGSPGSSPGPIYSWAGGVSGGNTPQHNEGGNTRDSIHDNSKCF